MVRAMAEGASHFDNLDRQRLHLNDYTIHAARRVAEVVPLFRYSPTTRGCFIPSERKLVVGEYYRKDLKSTRDLPNDHVKSTSMEEIAHALDHLYGNVSGSVAFRQAFREDWGRLKQKEQEKLLWIYNLEGLSPFNNRTLETEIFAAVYVHMLSGRHLRSFPTGEKFRNVRHFIQNVYLPGRGTVFPVRRRNS